MSIITEVANEVEKSIAELHEKRASLYFVDDLLAPILHPDLRIINCYYWYNILEITFSLTQSKLTLNEKMDIAFQMYDLGFAPYAYVYGGSPPILYIDSFNTIQTKFCKLKLSYRIGDEIPQEFKVEKIVKTVEQTTYEVTCRYS